MRRRLRALRRALAPERDEASSRAAALAPLSLWPPAPIVAGYLALESEIDPAPLLQRLAAAGARILLPAVTDRDAPLIFREAGEPKDLAADLIGLPAPPPSARVLVPDLLIVPLLAFDRVGGRLGQGGGFYDRTLRQMRSRGAVFAVGLAFAGQEVDRAPMGPGDERLDAVLTERGYIAFEKDRSCV
ncbi:MAG: 5-formyltetrahydrofolate cyclo-ligase [Caulobacteraceae bacterium]|nr:5-formyltetrahydrofolate cyclo-ligase [Caulobacteraceae bacterium]